MRRSQNFAHADSFPIFSHFFCFPFSLPFFPLYLLPFIPFPDPLEKFWPQPFLKPGNGALINKATWPILPPLFALKIGHVFSGIALPEFGRYSKWTHVWMDLSLLC